MQHPLHSTLKVIHIILIQALYQHCNIISYQVRRCVLISMIAKNVIKINPSIQVHGAEAKAQEGSKVVKGGYCRCQ